MKKKADTTSLHERTKLSERSERFSLRVEAHFLPTAIPFPLSLELPLPQSLPSLRNERGPYPTDQARGYSGQSIGKRACHHFSRPIGAGSFTRRRRHCAVTSLNVKDRPLAAKLWSPSSCSPSLVFHPYSPYLVVLSFPFPIPLVLRSVRQWRFSSLFRAAKSATRRTHVPLRAEQRCCVYIRVHEP